MTDRTKAMDILIAQDADLIELASGVTEADREVLIRISNSDDETAQRIRRGLIYTWEVGEIARHRKAAMDYWYRQGKDDGAEHERAKIVEWLRSDKIVLSMDGSKEDIAASAIEAGEHLR